MKAVVIEVSPDATSSQVANQVAYVASQIQVGEVSGTSGGDLPWSFETIEEES